MMLDDECRRRACFYQAPATVPKSFTPCFCLLFQCKNGTIKIVFFYYEAYMQEHHQKTIDNFINKVKSDNKYLAVILCGSIAQGLEKKDSDIDVYLVVTDDEYEKAVAELATAYFNFEVSTYEGGYIDGKIINYDFLVKAKKFGSEPTRASFIGAKVLWTKIDGLQMLIDQIPIFDETCREKKLQSFFAQVFTWGQFFYEESLAKNNLYLKQKSITETVFYGMRYVLEYNRILFPCHKSLFKYIEKAKHQPTKFIELSQELLSYGKKETMKEWLKVFYEFADIKLDYGKCISLFMENSEKDWVTNFVPIANC